MSGVRFTAWFDEAEKHAIKRAVTRHKLPSENYVVRVAVRALLLGIPAPKYLTEREDSEDQG